jgi:hypothetical protein
MPRYKNTRASVLGLNFRGDQQGPRLVNPGEEFDADAGDIPQSYLDQKWIEPASGGAPEQTSPAPGARPEPGTYNVPTDNQAAKQGTEPAQFEPGEQPEDPHTGKRRR